MRFTRNHPCFGWLSLNGEDYRYVYNKLIQMRDDDMARGDDSSGFPSGFEDWALTHLEELAKNPTYKKRISDHLDQMNLVIANRERELKNTYLVQELEKLKDRKQLIESFI